MDGLEADGPEGTAVSADGASAPPAAAPVARPPSAEELRAEAVAVARRLREAGYEALFAGGCVRDRLLGGAPKDYDIATSARPEEVSALFPHTVAVGAQFGVVLVVRGALSFEVATFRADGAYVDGRRPSAVYYGDPKGDAERRDFTINGLFEDPESGAIVDHVGGRADLAARIIRAIGDPAARFREDKLRLLRAVRFAAQLGFTIEPGTLAAVTAHAGDVAAVAAERVLMELTKTIVAPGRVRGLELLRDTGLLRVLLPEVAALEGVAQPPQYHPEGDCWQHQLLVMRHLPEQPPEALAWGALLHDVGKPPTFTVAERIRFDGHDRVGAEMAEQVMRRLRSSRALRETVVELVRDHLWFINADHMRRATQKRFLRGEHAALHLALHRADCLGCHGKLDTWERCVALLEELRKEGEEEALRPKPLLGGKDLIDLGLAPGPRFREILEAIETAQLEGQLADREGALAFVRERWLADGAGGARGAAGDAPKADGAATAAPSARSRKPAR